MINFFGVFKHIWRQIHYVILVVLLFSGSAAISSEATPKIILGYRAIYSINPDGSDLKLLFNLRDYKKLNLLVVEHLSWSPDYKKILFEARYMVGKELLNDIFVMDANGENVLQLTKDGICHHPDWSPDGSSIIFVKGTAKAKPDEGIFIMNPDGSSQKLIIDNHEVNGLCKKPSWSPDGKLILYESRWSIYTIDSTGRNKRRLSTTTLDIWPKWSPDGSKIIYISDAEREREVSIMNSDGSKKTRLTNDPDGPISHLSFSPDGQKIVFDYYSSKEGHGIYVMNSDGSGRTKISDLRITAIDW